MKTNGKPSKGSKPYVPGGLPLAKNKGPQGGRGKSKSSRPLFQYDNPNYSEIEWLDKVTPVKEKETDGGDDVKGSIRTVKLHGAVAVPAEQEVQIREADEIITVESLHSATSTVVNSAPKPPSSASVENETRYGSELSVRAQGTTRLLPRQQLAEENQETQAPQKSRESISITSTELQHGTIPFAFRERSRVDLIVSLPQPYKDSSYSFVCSLDIPHCHAVVRAKLNSEAVVTLIRTQEEGNPRGRLDWIAAGSLAGIKEK